MSQTKRLSELKPGDHMWWEGEICKIESIERNGNSHGSYAVQLEGWSEPDALQEGDHWACPTDEEVAEHYRAAAEWREARLRDWKENRPRHEAKCIAKAREVAVAFGKDPDVGEKQMREKLDAERRAFEEEFGQEEDPK